MRRPAIVATDFSPPAREALRYARRFSSGRPLHLFHAFDWSDSKTVEAVTTELERGGGTRDEAIGRLLRREAEGAGLGEGEWVPAHDRAASPGKAAPHAGRVVAAVLAYAERVGAGVVVAGRHGRGSRLMPRPPRWLGSVSLGLVRVGTADTLVVPPRPEDPWSAWPTRRVVAAVDGASGDGALVARAEAVAQEAGAALDLLHVVDLQAQLWSRLADPDPPAQAEQRVRGELAALASAESRAGVHLRHGPPASEIAGWVRDHRADLVVMGSRRPDAVDRALIGSVAERVIGRAGCPVWVVRADEDREGGAGGV